MKLPGLQASKLLKLLKRPDPRDAPGSGRLGSALARVGPWWAQRPPRERWMLLGGSIAAALVLMDTLWTAPLEKQLRRANAELTEREESLNKASQVPLPAANELQRLREQEAALRERLQLAQAAATRMGKQTAELPQVLRTLTGQGGTGGSLKLLALELLPDVAATQPAASAATSATTSAGTPVEPGKRRLYRLPVQLSVSGSYDDLQRLMQSIERDAPSLQWMSVSVDSSDWPAIKLTLRAQAISTRPTWGSAS